MQRRNFLRIGGLGLCGLGLLDFVRAKESKARAHAKHLIVCWLGGGPPHTDMFDMKPDSPVDRRGEFKPIASKVPGLRVCELMPKLAQWMDRVTLIRSVSTLNKPGNHGEAPLYWLTGNPRLRTGTEDYPTYGSVISKLRPGPADVPTYSVLGHIDSDDGSRNTAGQSFLGPVHAPFILDPTQSGDAITRMLTPQHELSDFERDNELLQKLDKGLRRLDRAEAIIEGLDEYQKKAFDMLRSPRLRRALDLSLEPLASRERYARLVPAKPDKMFGNPLHFLLARRLIEAGAPVVHFALGYWDWHSGNFTSGRKQIPMFDAGLTLLLEDLEARGLLESTIVLALGEMGRTSAINGGKGRDHNDHAQFVLAAGGGFRRGAVVGATDKLGDRVTDKFYKIESFARTLYHLLGLDADTILTTPAGRPVKVIAEDAPLIKEAIL